MTTRMQLALSLVAAFMAVITVGAFADSHVRIVRLSYTDGQVSMERAAGQGLERAILNAPVVEGARLVTGNDGLAEVEFEDQSALRLAENSDVTFTQLSMNDSGSKINQVEVTLGVVFFDVQSKGADTYRVTANGTTFLVRRDTRMRLSSAPDQLQVAVFRGDVQVEGQQLASIKKNETFTADPQNVAGYTIARGTESLPVDAWNQERESYDSAYAHNQGYGGPNTAFGLQDLNYYGTFNYYPSIGYAWQPFGIGSWASWNPYMAGAWMFYPGMGYTWASAYPWGWLPFHYGSWAYASSCGWVWLPGRSGSYRGNGYATSWLTVPAIASAPVGFSAPRPPLDTAVARVGVSNSTVTVGRIGNGSFPAYIPGGRIPPDFASVINRPGPLSGARTTSGLASTPARGQIFQTPAASAWGANSPRMRAEGFGVSPTARSTPGHVFVPPAPSAWAGRGAVFGPDFSGRGSGWGSVGSSVSSVGRASTASHASSGSAGHH